MDLRKTVDKISRSKAKKVLLQLPDGLKPKAQEIQKFLEKRTDAQILIWAGSAFGSCDLPLEAKNIGVDMIVHFGHTKWRF